MATIIPIQQSVTPTSDVENPMAIDNYTVLYLPMQGANNGTVFQDFSPSGKTFTATNTTTSTIHKRYGIASALFNGVDSQIITSNQLTEPSLPVDFTIDFWVYFNSTNVTQRLFAIGNYISATSLCALYQLGALSVYYNSSTKVQAPWTLITGAWLHIALIRIGTTLRFYVNGIQIGSDQTYSVSVTTTTGCYIGNWYGIGTESLGGHMQDFRISKTARWTSNFIPPAFPYGGYSLVDGVKS